MANHLFSLHPTSLGMYLLVIVIKEGGLLSSRLFFLTGKLSDEVRYEKKADTPIEMMTIQ